MRERQREIKYRYTENARQRRRQRRERCSHKPRNTAATGAGGDQEQILPKLLEGMQLYLHLDFRSLASGNVT